MHTKAWTGGSAPLPLRQIGQDERLTLKRLFRGNVQLYATHWNSLPLHIARILWRRARFDAHATHR